ncbi:MAG: HPF/RaiA family ribosome-associated protein [Deltaproteobacteria bacterium]
MKVLVRGIQQQVSDGTRAFVQKRVVDRIARFYDDQAAELLVDLIGHGVPRRDLQPECRLTLFMPGLRAIHVEETGDNLRMAIDLAGDRLSIACRKGILRAREHGHHHWRTRDKTAVRFPNSMLPPNFATYPLYPKP